MIKNPTRRIAVLFLVSDLLATLAALVAAYVLRFRAEIVPVTKGIPDAGTYYRLFPVIAILWPIVYYFYGLYSVRRHRSRIEEAFAVLVATGLATLLLTGLATFYRGFSYSRLVLLLFFAADVFFVFAGRTAIRRYLEEAWRHGVGVRQGLVVGAWRLGRAPQGWGGAVPRGPGRRRDFRGGGRRGRACRGHGLSGAAARRPPHDARRVERRRAHGRRCPRRAGSAPAHHLPRRRRRPRRPAGRAPHAGAPLGLDEPRQADGGPRRLERVAPRPFPRFRRDRSGNPPRRPGPDLLPPAPHGPGRPAFRHPEVSLDGPRRRGRFRPDLGEPGRPSAHARRTVPAPLEPRRVAAARQRPSRRDVPRRAAPGEAGVRPRVQGGVPPVHAAPPRPRRHDRLGAGPRLARQHEPHEADRVRPLLHRELDSLTRRQDPLDDPAPRPDPPQRLLRSLRVEFKAPGHTISHDPVRTPSP